MDRWVGRVALVTGASSGIGEAVCKQLVEEGMIVVGAARRVVRIQALAEKLKGKKGSLVGVKCDLTKDADIENLFTFVKKEYKGVDVMINNAGFAHKTGLLDGTPAEWREMTDVNVISLCLCSKLAIKSMRDRKVDDGQVIHISSMGGHHVPKPPQGHFYSSTKHAVRALTEGLRLELSGMKSNIRVASISPGLVDTEFGPNVMGAEAMERVKAAYPFLNAEDIAQQVCNILRSPPHVQVHDILILPTSDQFS